MYLSTSNNFLFKLIFLVLIIFSVNYIEAVDNVCKLGYELIDDNCYKYIDEEVHIDQAKQMCQDDKAKLLQFSSDESKKKIMSKLNHGDYRGVIWLDANRYSCSTTNLTSIWSWANKDTSYKPKTAKSSILKDSQTCCLFITTLNEEMMWDSCDRVARYVCTMSVHDVGQEDICSSVCKILERLKDPTPEELRNLGETLINLEKLLAKYEYLNTHYFDVFLAIWLVLITCYIGYSIRERVKKSASYRTNEDSPRSNGRDNLYEETNVRTYIPGQAIHS